jgi:uncharacterized protein (UPF0248 family)
MNAKQVLDELKWRKDRDLANAVIYYIHRGAPDDTKTISGKDILETDASFFTTSESSVPYHRIFRIEHKGAVIFERRR